MIVVPDEGTVNNFNSDAITEEESWIKIEYENGKFGWTREGYFGGLMAGKEYSNVPERVILHGFSSADDVGP